MHSGRSNTWIAVLQGIRQKTTSCPLNPNQRCLADGSTTCTPYLSEQVTALPILVQAQIITPAGYAQRNAADTATVPKCKGNHGRGRHWLDESRGNGFNWSGNSSKQGAGPHPNPRFSTLPHSSLQSSYSSLFIPCRIFSGVMGKSRHR